MKKQAMQKFFPVFMVFLALALSCAKFNVPNEELRKALPPEPAKEIKDLSIKFITVNYKLYSCLSELDQSLNTPGVPSDPENTGQLLDYADEFIAETGKALADVREWGIKNKKKLDELVKKAPRMKTADQPVLVHYMALTDPVFQEKQATFMAAIKVYLEAARREHEFIKAEYSNIVLGLGDSTDRYLEMIKGVTNAKRAFNLALKDVSECFGPLAESHAKSMGIPFGDSGSENRLSTKENQ